MHQRVRFVSSTGIRAVEAAGLLCLLAVLAAGAPLPARAAGDGAGTVHAAAVSPPAGQTGHVDEFRGPCSGCTTGVSQTADSDPLGITTGSDGNLWFTDSGASTIGKISKDFTGFQEFHTNTPGATPVAITGGPDNRLWFVENSSSVDSIGRFNPQAKTSNEFAIGTPRSIPTDITVGPDGNLWFTEFGNGNIGTIHTDGRAEHDFPLPGAGPTSTVVFPQSITSGPTSNLWFTEQGIGKIGEMTTAGVLMGEFPSAGGLQEVDGITMGPDGNIWFTEKAGNKIGVMSPSGALLHEYPTSGNPTAIITGPDSNVWYVEQSGNNIARITTSGTITEYAVPTSGAFSPNVQPTGLTVGPDRNIWFTEQDGKAAIARLTVVTQFGLAPSPADFGIQAVGTTSAAKVLTLTSNDGLPRLVISTSITGANAGDFAIGPDSCAGIVISSTCTVSVTFRPTAAGPRTATLSISDTGTGSPHQAILTGIGLAPGAVALSPDALNYGNLTLGTTKTVVFALTNNSPSDVTVTADALGGANPGDFAISNDQCKATTVAPAMSCTLSVTFSPQSAGTRSAMLSMTDTASNSPQTSTLTGTGVQPAGSVGLSPTSFSFGLQTLGTTSTAATFTLTNNTSGNVTVTATALDGANAGDFAIGGDHCRATTLSAGASCTLSVTFSPQGAGTRNATLSISDSRSTLAHTATLGGTGTTGSTGVVATPSPGAGYWEVASDGGIFSFGTAAFYGSTGSIRLNKPIVGMAATPDRRGYWLVATDGGIFNFGNAAFYGSTGSIRLNKPIVGMAPTPDGHGYWLVASDGGIFNFGNAGFFGSTGAIALNKPIVGMTPTPDGHGYWMVATDGGIFTFGNAAFYGSTGSIRLNKPIVGMAATPDGAGYLLAASDGGIFTFGNAVFRGSTGAIRLNKPIVSMVATADGGGYWLSATDGGIFNFGNAGFFGSTGSIRLNQPMVGMAGAP